MAKAERAHSIKLRLLVGSELCPRLGDEIVDTVVSLRLEQLVNGWTNLGVGPVHIVRVVLDVRLHVVHAVDELLEARGTLGVVLQAGCTVK